MNAMGHNVDNFIGVPEHGLASAIERAARQAIIAIRVGTCIRKAALLTWSMPAAPERRCDRRAALPEMHRPRKTRCIIITNRKDRSP